MHALPLLTTVEADPPLPFTDKEIGSAAHEKHMPSVRALAVDPDHGLVLLNLIGADVSVSAVTMELLRSKSNGVGFMRTLVANQAVGLPTQLAIQPGSRYTIFRSALATPGGSISMKNWCLLIATANIAESRRSAPVVPPQLLLSPPPSATANTLSPLPSVQSPARPPQYVIGVVTATTPDPNALLGICARLASSWPISGLPLCATSHLRHRSSRRFLPPASHAGVWMAT
jgi:hypothetical protein